MISPSFWIAGLIPMHDTDSTLIERSRNLLRDLDIISPPFWQLLSEQPDYVPFLTLPIYKERSPLPDYLQLPSHFSLDINLLSSKMKEFKERI